MSEPTLDYTAIGPRLRQAREQAGISLEDAAMALDNAENGAQLPAVAMVKLVMYVYQCQLNEILHGPYPYQSQAEWIQAFMKGEITEGTLARGLKVDRLEARRQVQEYERAEPQI